MDRRKILLTLGGLAIVAFAVSSQTWAKTRFKPAVSKTPVAVEWQHDLKAAHKVAVTLRRPMMIVFSASWCVPCQKLKKETLSDPALARFVNSEFVPVLLDLDTDRQVAEVLEVTKIPTTVVLSPEADLLGFNEGFVAKAECQQMLRKALAAGREVQATASVTPRRK